MEKRRPIHLKDGSVFMLKCEPDSATGTSLNQIDKIMHELLDRLEEVELPPTDEGVEERIVEILKNHESYAAGIPYQISGIWIQDFERIAKAITTLLHQDAQEMTSAKQYWNDYKAFLENKYPPKKGEKFEFTCEHHQKLDAIFAAFGDKTK